MDRIARVRRFNRAVTLHVGALEQSFLGRGRPLGASRLLFEIGRSGDEVRRLRARLGLDSGYLSRLLRDLERDGLVRTGASPDDARVRVATLTAAGRRELARLDRLSDRSAGALLEALSEQQRETLTSSMDTVARLLQVAAVRIALADPRGAPACYCLDRYFGELAERFDAGFDPGRSISAEADELTPPRGYFVLAMLHGEPLGCGALKCLADHGEVKRMWVAGLARGLGIGRRILERLEALARRRRLPLLRLETNRSLVEAQALYRSSGYREVERFNDEPYAHHWFEKAL